MKGQLNVDNYVINKLNKLKCGPLLSIISNTWVDFQDPRVYVQYDLFVSMLHIGCMENMSCFVIRCSSKCSMQCLVWNNVCILLLTKNIDYNNVHWHGKYE